MNQYGAHILAAIRRTEFAAEAAESRRAAAVRERSTGRSPLTTGHRVPVHRPATT